MVGHEQIGIEDLDPARSVAEHVVQDPLDREGAGTESKRVLSPRKSDACADELATIDHGPGVWSEDGEVDVAVTEHLIDRRHEQPRRRRGVVRDAWSAPRSVAGKRLRSNDDVEFLDLASAIDGQWGRPDDRDAAARDQLAESCLGGVKVAVPERFGPSRRHRWPPERELDVRRQHVQDVPMMV